MITRFVGDVHGKTESFFRLVEQAEGDGTSVFQIGDMGLGFQGTYLPHLNKQHKFIRGNHDDPYSCRVHPNYAGDWGYDETKDLFFLGGAWSIDWKWRQDHMLAGGNPVWWPDEELPQEDLDKAFEAYISVHPRIVATHECPSSIADELLRPMLIGSGLGGYFDAKLACKNTRTSNMLERMFQVHQPKIWVFGHYHVDRTMKIRGTTFRCCAELSTFDVET